MDHRSINFMSFNVRSLVNTSRRVDLLNTLSYNKIDIGLIQECHLKSNNKVRLKGYKFLYDNSPIGVAIVIKDSISYNHVVIDNIGFNSTFISIEFNVNNIRKKFLIGSIYFPCNFSTAYLFNGLSIILNSATTYDGFILGGDLNGKHPVWGDHYENSNGKILNNWLLDNTLDVTRICHNTPSFPNGSSFLDHFLISPRLINPGAANIKISSLPSFSDHFPIKLELQLNSYELIMQNPSFFTSYKNTNWQQFRRDLEIATFSIMPPEDRNLRNDEIDSLLNEFNINFNAVHNSHSEKIEFKDNKIPLPENIKKIFRIKYRWQRDLKKIFHRYGNRLSPEYQVLSKQIQLVKIIIKELVNMDQAKKFNERLEILKRSTKL